MSVRFSDHVALLNEILSRRQAIIEQIEGRLLNVQGKEASRNRSRDYFERILNGCFYDLPGLPRDLARLQGELAAAHLADGFEPVLLDEAAHRLDPLELILRAYQHWERQRWPGRNGRLAYARVLYGVFMICELEALSLRIWDDETEAATDRLEQVQRLLDRLNSASPDVLVRDARWLIQTAQGPLTRHLAPYFRIAERISGSLTGAARLEVHSAGAKLAGGHLRSQLRSRGSEMDLSIDHPSVLAITRNSNSMDAALLVGDLVPLLDAYEAARHAGDNEARLDLADAILQGLSAEPELFLTRLDLLGPGTVIEDLFVERDERARARPSAMGAAHLTLLERYGRLIGEAAGALRADAARFDPERRTYSPLGIVYGFCADVLSKMALSTLHAGPAPGISLEAMFDGRTSPENELARARLWERLPAHDGAPGQFEHSLDWAARIFQRTTAALDARAAHPTDRNASSVTTARLFVVPKGRTEGSPPDGVVPAQEHCVTSDVNRALATGTTAFPKSQILRDRNEGRFLASAEIDGKWFGVSKTILTEVIGRGRDALITDVPEQVLEVLRLTCSGLVAVVAEAGS